jgi:hypothetical protein
MANQKTCGVFNLLTKNGKKLVYAGASTQIEICVRDYMKWCQKGIAPKPIQAAYNAAGERDATTLFDCVIVEKCEPSQLKVLKAKYGLTPSKSAVAPTQVVGIITPPAATPVRKRYTRYDWQRAAAGVGLTGVIRRSVELPVIEPTPDPVVESAPEVAVSAKPANRPAKPRRKAKK